MPAMKEKQSKNEPVQEIVKITVRLPRALLDAMQHRAIDERCSMQALTERAFRSYLKQQQKAGRP
jgi:hypothetical protein